MSKQILILNGSPRIHGNTAALIDAFTAGAEAAGRRPAGPPLELYRVDAHDTNLEEEYVTELQMRVEPAQAGS